MIDLLEQLLPNPPQQPCFLYHPKNMAHVNKFNFTKNNTSVITSLSGDHNFTAESIPLDAIKHALECGCTQFTIDESPLTA